MTKYRPGTITIEDPSLTDKNPILWEMLEKCPHCDKPVFSLQRLFETRSVIFDAFVFECPKCGAMWRDQ
jgi:predicted RNA-binding Zn-ribbon protein involved in translation (DUF1610 family)